MLGRLTLFAILALSLSSCGEHPSRYSDANAAVPDHDGPAPEGTIMALMIAEVMPATDTLWRLDNPRSAADWQELAAAAERATRAFEQTKSGGSGPRDDTWAADPRWRAYVDAAVAASAAANAAIAARDAAALEAALDAIRVPCDGCHVEFHPDVRIDFDR